MDRRGLGLLPGPPADAHGLRSSLAVLLALPALALLLSLRLPTPSRDVSPAAR